MTTPQFSTAQRGGRPSATNTPMHATMEERVAALEARLLDHPRVYVGTITVSSGTGSQSFTGFGVKPRLVVVYGAAGADSTSVLRFTMGAATADTTGRSVGIRADSTDGQRVSENRLYTVLSDNNATSDAYGNLASFDDDGFTITRGASIGSDFDLFVIVVG